MKSIIVLVIFILLSACNITETDFHEEYRMNIKVQESCLSMIYVPEYQIPRAFTIDWSNVSDTLDQYCKDENKEFGWTTTVDTGGEFYQFTVISIQPDPYNF